RTMPRAVLRGERQIMVFGRKLLACVECHAQRRGVRLQEHVGHDHLVSQVRTLSLMTWVLVRTDIVPGPAVKAAVLDVRHVVRREMITEFISLIDGGP